jgi:hypothetical protein
MALGDLSDVVAEFAAGNAIAPSKRKNRFTAEKTLDLAEQRGRQVCIDPFVHVDHGGKRLVNGSHVAPRSLSPENASPLSGS